MVLSILVYSNIRYQAKFPVNSVRRTNIPPTQMSITSSARAWTPFACHLDGNVCKSKLSSLVIRRSSTCTNFRSAELWTERLINKSGATFRTSLIILLTQRALMPSWIHTSMYLPEISYTYLQRMLTLLHLAKDNTTVLKSVLMQFVSS